MADKVEPDMKSLERALTNIKQPDKSFAPIEHRGINELVDEAEATLQMALVQIQTIKLRLLEFNRLQASFYDGK